MPLGKFEKQGKKAKTIVLQAVLLVNIFSIVLQMPLHVISTPQLVPGIRAHLIHLIGYKGMEVREHQTLDPPMTILLIPFKVAFSIFFVSLCTKM